VRRIRAESSLYPNWWRRVGTANRIRSVNREQRSITDGRIIPVGRRFVRKAPKKVDYLLHYTRDFPLAVIEAKAAYRTAADGVQQAKQYAEMLGLIHRALLGTLQHKRHTPIGLCAGCALSATVHPGICPTDSIQNKPGHSCRELRLDSNG
jgi:hypothetical protein